MVGTHFGVGADAVRTSGEEITAWARRFELFADPTRLRLLIALHAAPDSSVTELASATGATPNAVTQSLATLNAAGVLSVRKDGRFRRWRITDDDAHRVLHHMHAPHSRLHPEHEH